MGTTIDITPNRAEAARTYAYIMASHGSDFAAWGDYDAYTTRQEDAIATAWHIVEGIAKALEDAELKLWDMPEDVRGEIMRAAQNKALAAPGVWNYQRPPVETPALQGLLGI